MPNSGVPKAYFSSKVLESSNSSKALNFNYDSTSKPKESPVLAKKKYKNI